MNIKPTTTWGFTSRFDWGRLFRDVANENARVSRVTCPEAPEGQKVWTVVRTGSSEARRIDQKAKPLIFRSWAYNLTAYLGDHVNVALGVHTYEVEAWK